MSKPRGKRITKQEYNSAAFFNFLPGFGQGYRVVNRPKSALVCVFGSLAAFLMPPILILLSIQEQDDMGLAGLAIAFGFVLGGLAVVGLINIPSALHLLVVAIRQPKKQRQVSEVNKLKKELRRLRGNTRD